MFLNQTFQRSAEFETLKKESRYFCENRRRVIIVHETNTTTAHVHHEYEQNQMHEMH